MGVEKWRNNQGQNLFGKVPYLLATDGDFHLQCGYFQGKS